MVGDPAAKKQLPFGLEAESFFSASGLVLAGRCH